MRLIAFISLAELKSLRLYWSAYFADPARNTVNTGRCIVGCPRKTLTRKRESSLPQLHDGKVRKTGTEAWEKTGDDRMASVGFMPRILPVQRPELWRFEPPKILLCLHMHSAPATFHMQLRDRASQ